MTYVVLDSCIDVNSQKYIHSHLMGKETNWKFARYFSYGDNPEVNDDGRKNMFNFSNIIFDHENINNSCEMFIDIVRKCSAKLPWDLNNVFKIRSELQLPIITEKTHGNPHVDCHISEPYIVLLYYVNDSDGDTILFNQTTEHISTDQVLNGNLTEMVRVEPKAGRILAFDGNIYHASGRPKSNYRCIVNYNIYLDGVMAA